MNERLFENSITNGTNSKYSCTISSVIHSQNKLTSLICALINQGIGFIFPIHN